MRGSLPRRRSGVERAGDALQLRDRGAADYERGLEALRRGDASAAVDALECALEAGYDGAEASLRLGEAELARSAPNAALDHLELALHYRPGWALALRMLGAARLRVGHYQLAASALEEVLAGEAKDAAALSDLSLAYRELGRFAEAEQACRDALAIDPALEAARFNLALVIRDQGHLAEAERLLETMLEERPNDDELRWSLAVTRLLDGNFSRAWSDYEARWSTAHAIPRARRFASWDGSNLGGRRILLWGEQGLGDEIMFASCVPEVARAARGCVLECSPALEVLFTRSFPGVEVVPVPANAEDAGSRPVADCEAPVGSLPGLLGRGRGAFPAHEGYLRAAPEAVAYWRARLKELGGGLKVGISWRGGDARTRQRLRSIPLAEWAPILAVEECKFVSLQYGSAREDLTALPRGSVVHHWSEAIDDYDQTAALVCALDLVVSVCTAIVHLSGALGRPAWVFVPSAPEWRYLQRGARMPWYPSVRLYRQESPLVWSALLRQAAADLAQRACGRWS